MEEKNWIGKVIGGITNAFARFVGVFKKNGLIYSLVILILFVLLWSLIIYPIRLDTLVEKRLEMQWEKEREHLKTEKVEAEEKRIKADEIVSPILDDIVERFGVDRMLMLELHNNSQNINGTDFLYFSSSYESIDLEDYEIDYISDNLQRQSISIMFGVDLFKILSHKDYIYYPSLSDYKRNRRILSKLQKLGCENVMMMPIKDANGKPSIILVVGNREQFDAEAIFAYIKPFIQQIEQMLT